MIKPKPEDIGKEVAYRPHFMAPWQRGRLREIIAAKRPIDVKVVIQLPDGAKRVRVSEARWTDMARERAERTLWDDLMSVGFGAMMAGMVVFLAPLAVASGALPEGALAPSLIVANLLVGGGFAAVVAAGIVKTSRGELK